ncbi:hypothetical protein [Candidatus Phytoplasma asteris]
MTIKDRLLNPKKTHRPRPFVKNRHPFDRRHEDGDTYDMTIANRADDSQLYLYVSLEKQIHKVPGSNYLILHFNPKRKTLSLFQDKQNNDKVQESENNKRTNSELRLMINNKVLIYFLF